MNLHKNKQEVYDTLLAIGNKLNISPAVIFSIFTKTILNISLNNETIYRIDY